LSGLLEQASLEEAEMSILVVVVVLLVVPAGVILLLVLPTAILFLVVAVPVTEPPRRTYLGSQASFEEAEVEFPII